MFVKVDKILDVVQILEKKYNPKKADFFQISKLPVWIISEKDRIVGIEIGEVEKLKKLKKLKRNTKI